METAPSLVSLSPLDGNVRPSTAAETYRRAACGATVPHTPSTDFFRRHFAATHTQHTQGAAESVASCSGRPASTDTALASRQKVTRQPPGTAPGHAASEANSGSLSAAERSAMKQAVASKLKSMARSLRPTVTPEARQRHAESAPGHSGAHGSGWRDASQTARQPQAAHLPGWEQMHQQPAGAAGVDWEKLAQLQSQQRPSTTPSGPRPGPRSHQPPGLEHLPARPSTSTAAERPGAGGWGYGHSHRSHNRMVRSFDSALGAPLHRQAAPVYSTQHIASAKPPPPPGAAATGTAQPLAQALGPRAGHHHTDTSAQPRRFLYAPTLFADTRRTPRVTTTLLTDSCGASGSHRPSRGTMLSVFEDLDAFGEGRVTFSTFEQAAIAVGMKHHQVTRLFSRLDPRGKGYITVHDWGRPDVEGPLGSFTRLFIRRTRASDGRHKDAQEVQSLYAALQMALFKLQLKNSGRSVSHERLLQAFKFIDRDGSGALDKREVLDAFNGMGIYVKAEVLEEAMHTFDKNGDGMIQYQEFISTLFPNLSKGFTE